MAKVSTDKSDYAPGETATITAEGYTPGSTIEFQVQHLGPGPDGLWGTSDDADYNDSGSGHEPWTVLDGGEYDLDGIVNGIIQTEWFVDPDDSLNETFLLTATGAGVDGVAGTADDEIATTTFTDSIIITPGASVTHDESDGYQNAVASDDSDSGVTSDEDDNDINISTTGNELPSDFSGRLIELLPSIGDLPALTAALNETNGAGVALSGYDGSDGDTGLDAFTVAADGDINNYALTDASGDPLAGTRWVYDDGNASTPLKSQLSLALRYSYIQTQQTITSFWGVQD